MQDGNYLPIQGKGNQGRFGGMPGDLIIIMEEKDHDLFIRENDHIIYKLTISYPEAVLGTELEVPTLYGPEKQPGTTLTIHDKGIPHLNSYGKGNQFVVVNVYVPEKVSGKEKELVKSMSDNEKFYPEKKDTHKSGFLGKVWDKIFEES